MKRGTPMRRTRMVRGKPTTHEAADYRAVHVRSRDQCEVALDGHRCPRPRMRGCHHITKRSQGGAGKGPDYLIDLCYFHHDLTDNASVTQFSRSLDGEGRMGRLRIEPVTFRCWMETASDRGLPEDSA